MTLAPNLDAWSWWWSCLPAPVRAELLEHGWGEPLPPHLLVEVREAPGALEEVTVHVPVVLSAGIRRVRARPRQVLTDDFAVWLDEQRSTRW
ncbi:hypothetical protein ACFFKU_06750 [Kineococcus gynurae]|uniref:Uncharacterized protein n=1 Tax=Kineococcus gynurae TaxID=452979 RepID=A0ABV5LX03_9ACTN